MRKNGVTYGELRQFLLKLGFAESTAQANQIRFEYSAAGPILLFPAHDGTETVTTRDLVVIRRQLLDNGLVEPPAFERFLARTSA